MIKQDSIEERLESHQAVGPIIVKNPNKFLIQSFVASLGAFYVGYNLGVMNLMLNTKLECFFNYGISQEGGPTYYKRALLTGTLPIGAIFGAILTSFLLDSIKKRRWIMYLCDILGIILAGVSICPNLNVLIGIRAFIGIIVGINSVIVPCYIREISPPEISQKTGIFNQGMMNMGIVTAFLMCFFLISQPISSSGDSISCQNYQGDPNAIHEGYKNYIFTVFPIFACTVRFFLILLVYKYDTIYYYYKADKQTASDLNQEMYHDKYEYTQYVRFIEEFRHQTKRQGFRYLFKECKRRLAIGIAVTFFQQFSGINVLIFYSSSIFLDFVKGYSKNKDEDNQIRQAQLFTCIMGGVVSIFAWTSIFRVQKIGKRKVLLHGILLLGVVQSLLFLCSFISIFLQNKDNQDDNDPFDYSSIVLIFVFIFIYTFSYGPTSWSYKADILKAKGLSLVIGMNWLFASVLAISTPFILDGILDLFESEKQKGKYVFQSGLFGIFSLLCFFGFGYCKKYLKETNGLTYFQLEDLFKEDNESCLTTDNEDSGYEE